MQRDRLTERICLGQPAYTLLFGGAPTGF